MRAVPFFSHGTADVLQYREDFAEPAGGPDQIVIDVEYCGLNHLDIWTRQGVAGKKIRLPHVCGCDIVGNVKSMGKVMVYPGISCGSCSYCKAGKENLCSQFAIIGGLSNHDGGYADKVAVPKGNVIKIPPSLKPESAATLAVSYLTAWNMLCTNHAAKGETVFVYGAGGGIGMATIQLAKALGATVITTVSGDDKRDFALRIGADHVIDRRAQDIAVEAAKFSAGGVDVVVDHVGAATWQTSISILKQGGRMAVCGMTSGNEATVPVRMFYTKQIVMTGALLGTRSQLAELVDFVVRNKIQPVVDSVVALDKLAQAHRKMEAGWHMGKILIKI